MMNLLSSKAILVSCVLVQTPMEKEAPITGLEEILCHSEVWDAKEGEKMKSTMH